MLTHIDQHPKDLNSDSNGQHRQSRTPSRPLKLRGPLPVFMIMVIIGLGGAGLWIATIMSYSCSQAAQARDFGAVSDTMPEENQTNTTDCGLTVEEAVAKDCKFDPISFTWLPASCFDGELIEQFLSVKDWQWYSEASNTSLVDFEIVQRGELAWLFVTREFHLYHCAYQWRRMHRAILHGWPLDAYIGNYTHTEHCAHVLVQEGDPTGWAIVDVQIRRKFVMCGRDHAKSPSEPIHVE